jgi:hypothetical protein
MSSEKKKIPIDRVIHNPDQPPKPLHRVFWTRVGIDTMLDVGYFDLVDLRRVDQEGFDTSEPLPFHITDRFFVNPESALHLLSAAQGLVDSLVENGLISADALKEFESHDA